jgi:hypothetical protein
MKALRRKEGSFVPWVVLRHVMRTMMNETFKRGNFVKLKKGSAGSVGVVWEIHSKNIKSILVYWLSSEGRRESNEHEPGNLELVPTNQAPDYAIELKKSLGL